MAAPKAQKKRVPAGNVATVPGKLVPDSLCGVLFYISLAVPNLVFSGVKWFDTLHLWKWTVAMVPMGIVALLAGVALLRKKTVEKPFRVDFFGWVWFFILLFVTFQPLWVNLSSYSTTLKEWFYLATLVGGYVLFYNVFSTGRLLHVVMLGAAVNASINVLFAELTVRGLNGGLSFILNVPNYYIGNTAQQEMFGLWMAMNVLNGIYLHWIYGDTRMGEGGRKFLMGINLFLLLVNTWGLWNSTARGAILSLILGIVILLVIAFLKRDRLALRRIAIPLAVVLGVLLVTVALSASGVDIGRGSALVSKTVDMIQNPTAVGKRIGIWKTSWAMFRDHWLGGVGLGHYKWHYLDAQRKSFDLFDGQTWQFTYWAHSEYIQWFCEMGIFGGIVFAVLIGWWNWLFCVRLFKERERFEPPVAWACSMLFLVWFDALFSRPFHRIENVLWVSLAFAVANRALLSDPSWGFLERFRSPRAMRALGGLFVAVTLAGFAFLIDGMIGDKLLWRANQTNDANLQYERIERALGHPMMRDEAQEQLAYHYIGVAQASGLPEDLKRGVDQLYKSFLIRPQAKQLNDLLRYLQQLGDTEFLKKMLYYLKPGSYSFGPPAKGSSGSSGQ